MKEPEVRELLAQVKPGTRLALTYRVDYPQDPFYLLGMEHAGIIHFENEMVKALINAVYTSQNWAHDENRTITIVATEKFDQQWFVDRCAWPLEKLEIVKDENEQFKYMRWLY